MAYIPDTKSYQPCTTNDIAKRRGIYTSEVQDYLVEFATLHPDADIQILSISNDPKTIEAGTDVLINTTQGTFILYPGGEFELAENGKTVRRNQTAQRNRARDVYTKAVIDGLKGLGISTNQIKKLRREEYNLVKLDKGVVEEYRQKHSLDTDFDTAARRLDDDIRTHVIDVVANTYGTPVEGGWVGDLYDTLKIRSRVGQLGKHNTSSYLIFVPLAE